MGLPSESQARLFTVPGSIFVKRGQGGGFGVTLPPSLTHCTVHRVNICGLHFGNERGEVLRGTL